MDDVRPELTEGRKRGPARAPSRPLLAALLVGSAGISLALVPAAQADLGRTFGSPEALASAVLDGLERNDGEGLRELDLSRREFEHVVWPELPVYGHIPLDYVFTDLAEKNRRRLGATLARHGGERYTLVAVRFEGERQAYRSFVVHKRPRLIVLDAEGRERELAVLGSILEREGRYKLFSYVASR